MSTLMMYRLFYRIYRAQGLSIYRAAIEAWDDATAEPQF